MENTENTANANLNPGRLDSATRVDPADLPRSYRVSRCTSCEGGRYAVAWKGGAARPACPKCGAAMTTTTRHLKAGFVVLEGDALELAERLEGGLLNDVHHALDKATYLRKRQARAAEAIAAGNEVLPSGYVRIGTHGLEPLPEQLDSYVKRELAKAAKFRRRLDKLGGPVGARAITRAKALAETEAELLGLAPVAGGSNEFDELELEVLGALNELVEGYTDNGEVLGAYLNTVELTRVVHRAAGPRLTGPTAAEIAELGPRVVGAGSRLLERGLVDRVVPRGKSIYYWRIRHAGAELVEGMVAAGEVERRGLPPAAGGEPTRRELAAELVVLARLDHQRSSLGHDYGAGQRGNELRRRSRDLGGAWVEVDDRTVRGIAHVGDYRPTGDELAAAARRLLAPRLRRVELEGFRADTPATRRTVEALKVTLADFTAEDLAAGLKQVAGGTNELDESIVELRGRVELERRRELADAERISTEHAGTYIAGEAAASCRRRAEGLEHVLAYAGRLAAAGDVRIAELTLAGALGDKPAARAAKAYKSDAELEAAERLSAAQDYTDGGGPVDEYGARLFDE